MTSRPLPGTPPHEVLLHVALGDHQVAPVTADVMARTIGARAWNKLDPGRSSDKQPFYGIPALTPFPYGGSALIVFDSGPFSPANPQGTPPAADGERAAERSGQDSARVPAPDAIGADDEGPVPADRGPAPDRAVRGRSVSLELVAVARLNGMSSRAPSAGRRAVQ